MRCFTIIWLLVAVAFVAHGADSDSVTVVRPVNASYTLGVGQGCLTDTYLSPLKYDGQAFSLDYERRQAMKFDPGGGPCVLRAA